MKVRCPDCGRQFEVSDQKQHRSLKCICKHIFQAQPVNQDSVSESGPSEGIAPEVCEYELDTESLEDDQVQSYAEFLRSSRPIKNESSSQPQLPSPSTEPISIELASSHDSHSAQSEDSDNEEVVSDEVEIQHQTIEPESERTHKQKPFYNTQDTNQSRLLEIWHFVRDRCISLYEEKPYLVIGAGAGVVALLLVVLYRTDWFEEEPEPIDPRLEKLLTPPDAKK